MAVINEVDEKSLDEWLNTRPEIIQKIARKIPPGRLYLLKTSNHRVYPYSYSEDGTMTVIVSGEYNTLIFDRKVFGINPDDLSECALPSDDEELGTILTDEDDIKSFCKYQHEKEVAGKSRQ